MGTQAIRSYRDLDVWKVAMDAVVVVYGLADTLPSSERFELSSQIRRSVVSIPSNVAEGFGRGGRAYRNHVLIALGSTAELETQIEAAVRLGLLSAVQVAGAAELLTRVGQMLHRLDSALRRKQLALTASPLALLGCAMAPTLLTLFG